MIMRIKALSTSVFVKGFLDGLGAPGLIYQKARLLNAPNVAFVTVPSESETSALTGDWQKVGGDIRIVIKRHAKTTESIRARKKSNSKRRK